MAPRSPPWKSQYSHLASATYLADLRSNRPTRPVGSRPLPSRPLPIPVQDENVPPRAESALSSRPQEKEGLDTMTEQKLSQRASLPNVGSLGSLNSQKGRPLVSSPYTIRGQRKVSPSSANTPYKESSARTKEREEAHALRRALEKMDQEDDDSRIHNAAKAEAADIVWKHRNPQLAEVEKTAAYRNPDLEKPNYGELGHAKKPSLPATEAKPAPRSASGESNVSVDSRKQRLPWLRKRGQAQAAGLPVATPSSAVAPSTPAESILQKGVRKISGKRRVSSGSGKGLGDPEIQIFDEARAMTPVAEEIPSTAMPLKARERNSLLRGTRPMPEKSMTDPLPLMSHVIKLNEDTKEEKVEARVIPATATRALPKTPVKESLAEPESNANEEEVRYIDGYEVRSDDIRAATSMRKSDRSPNLPTPTAVSDRPGRPIVSFDPKWRPGSDSPRNSQDLQRPQERKDDGSMLYPVKPRPSIPDITIVEDPASPALQRERQVQQNQDPPTIVVPSINLPEDEPSQKNTPLPSINLPEGSEPIVPAIHIEIDQTPSRPVPSISLQTDLPLQGRPLPSINISNGSPRPLPVHTQSSPSKLTSKPSRDLAARVPWLHRTPTTTSSVVQCTACTLPISGRIVTASGSATRTQKARFHPECFTCYHCSTSLEAVAFYPEPDSARQERIIASSPDLDPASAEIQELVHSNEDLRFFCHLDYHELFSPRCHNCKTPVEGAVILALGRHYHADHFFCAECGDPFSSESPFVEHNGYPYCVSCHTKRTSARCKACKQPILNEMTVEALGGKWHDDCFVCCECAGDFGEEGRFFVREVEVPLTEKEKRRGMDRKIEERAACQACEERRVKNVDLFM